MLTLSHVIIKIGEKQIIENFSYTFEEHKVYVIMGPNGSGKSTLAHAIMGDPTYTVRGSIFLTDGESGTKIDIQNMSADERSKAGIFLSFQTPLSLQGVRVSQLLQVALGKEKSAIQLRNEIKQVAKDLHIREELLQRGLNEGASGGERKKLELLQASILDKPIELYDEIDTGVDIDSLKDIGSFLHKRKKNKTYILITHYKRLLSYIEPDVVLILKDGALYDEGDYNLVNTIEKRGFDRQKRNITNLQTGRQII